MNLQPLISAAPAAAALVFFLVGCSDQDDPVPANTGGLPAVGLGSGGRASTGGITGVASGGVTSSGGITGVASGGVTSSGGITGVASGGVTSSGGTGGGGAAGGAASGGSMVPATFDTVTTVITQATCFGAGCHNDDQNPLNLRVDDQLYTRLTSRISTNCGGLPIVNPGNPQASALVKILKEPCPPTPRMPLGCVEDEDANCIPAEYIAAIEQWIASGAPQP